MPLTYPSGDQIKTGDKVRYHGKAAQIEIVVDAPNGDPATEWYFRELGPGVMVREPKAFGRVYVTQVADGFLEFVSRQDEV
jgi:hypothetical protein